ncbi:MAG: hypothetical protein NZ521_09320, partial [Flammeovirgaceae bacterium]|nr:hypothetical protein [Flammeovirgaceae bacterium]MDW8288406.1 hypothetical protein [Flammeovirgaceae bacterium]
MKKQKLHLFIRKTHRYLGAIIGIQLLAWVLGGLYFSWTNIEEIRGNTLRKASQSLNVPTVTVPLGKLIDQLQGMRNV